MQAQCSSCQHIYTLADNLAGKKVRCKGCDAIFEVQPMPEAVPPPPRNAVYSGTPSFEKKRTVRDREALDDDEFGAPRRPRKRRGTPQKTSSALWVVGICCGVFGFIGAFILAWVLLRGPQEPDLAKVKPIEPVPVGNVPQANPPANPPANLAIPINKDAEPDPPGLYGDQGGDEIAPADPRVPDTALRARAEDTFYRLSNPRIGRPNFGPGQSLLVDYQVVRRGKHGGGTLIIHGGDGRRSNVSLFLFGQQERGTIEVSSFGPFGSFPQNAELYMVRGDGRYGNLSPTFKVSNSVAMGVMAITTKARNWTREEIERYTKEPPNYTAANVHTGIGKDTPFVGDTAGGGQLRYLEPKGHLLGLEFRLAEWEKEKCIGGLTAIFSRDQPVAQPNRVLAKEGYVVSGAEVHTGKYVDGITLQFQRLRADGTLDAADGYASALIGYAGTGEPHKLAGDGRPVIGIHLRQGAILNGLALVTGERPNQ